MDADNTGEELAATIRLVDAIRAWAESYGSAVSISESINPGDEYGSYCAMTLRPRRPSACELEIHFVPANPPQVGVALDSRDRLVEGHQLPVAFRSASESQVKALFFEPRVLSLDTLDAICRAVSAGVIDLNVGIIGRHLVATNGGLRLSTYVLTMHGVSSVPFVVLKMLQPLGLARVLPVIYEPWLPDAPSGGDQPLNRVR